MERTVAEALMDKLGDFIVEYTNSTGKGKYFVGTKDFSAPHIATRKRPAHSTDGILTFCWDADKFKFVDPGSIRRITPLSAVLKNENTVTD